MLKVTILDGYVDEPTCLGVPPYISPYPRYIAGAIWCKDKSAKILYVTIDKLRNESNCLELINKTDLLIVIAGMAVPGKYLSGFPASPKELLFYLSKLDRPKKILSGPAAKYGFGLSGGKKVVETTFVQDIFDLIISGDGEVVIEELLKNNLSFEKTDPELCRANASIIKDYAIKGSPIVKQHPFFPEYLILEIETYRGCARSLVGGCSFCSEPQKGLPSFRKIEEIILEIQSLYSSGIRHFRIGNQPCIFSYMTKDAGKIEHPKPNPDALKKLFSGIRNVAPDLETLHIDNANPGVIAHYPNECKKIVKTIVRYHTSGDVAAFGIESADPEVVKQNNLKASKEEVLSAIKIINEIGSKAGSNGLPELLPGLNFVFGLKGETKNTFKHNYQFLQEILERNLLVRRVNLRQVIPIPGTEMFNYGIRNVVKHKSEFQRFKRKFRDGFERPMLMKIVPKDTILKKVYTETYKGKVTFGRQIGTYPILVGIPGIFPLNIFLDAKVVDFGYRSITAIPSPIDINKISPETLAAISGIGKKRVARIASKRPFRNNADIINSLDDENIGKKLLKDIVIK